MFRRYRHGGDSVASLTITDSEKLNAELNIYTGEAQGPSKSHTGVHCTLQFYKCSQQAAHAPGRQWHTGYNATQSVQYRRQAKSTRLTLTSTQYSHSTSHVCTASCIASTHISTAPHTAQHPRPHNIQITDGPPLLRHRVHVTSHGPLLQRRDTELEPAVAGDHGLLEAL